MCSFYMLLVLRETPNPVSLSFYSISKYVEYLLRCEADIWIQPIRNLHPWSTVIKE